MINRCAVLLISLLACAVLVDRTVPALAADLKGTARTIDGDTLVIGSETVRIHGIAAPEKSEPGGTAATQFMRSLVEGRAVVCVGNGERSHGRLVATCRLPDGRDVGAVMIEAGYARDCPRFSRHRYADAEKRARSTGRDLSKTYVLPVYCER